MALKIIPLDKIISTGKASPRKYNRRDLVETLRENEGAYEIPLAENTAEGIVMPADADLYKAAKLAGLDALTLDVSGLSEDSHYATPTIDANDTEIYVKSIFLKKWSDAVPSKTSKILASFEDYMAKKYEGLSLEIDYQTKADGNRITLYISGSFGDNPMDAAAEFSDLYSTFEEQLGPLRSIDGRVDIKRQL